MTLSRSRRRFLSRLGLGAGAWLLGPFCNGLVNEALGQTVRKKRLVIIANGNGLHETRYKHEGADAANLNLREVFKPLDPFKKDLLILEKFYNPFGVDTHGNHWAALCVEGTRKAPGGISLDRLVAKAIGKSDPISSTNLMLWDQENGKDDYHLSADGPGQVYPAEWNPLRAHAKIFGGNAVSLPRGTSPETLLQRDRSVLDFVTADIKRLEARLATPEKPKLAQYLESLRAFERQQTERAALAPKDGAISAPTVSSTTDFKETLVRWQTMEAHVDITYNALLGGLTRVSAVSLLANAGSFRPLMLPSGRVDHHRICHGSGNDATIAKVDQYFCSLVARLWQRLRATPEGNGTMADSTLLVWINSGGGVHHGGHNNHAVVMLGGGGYFRTGRYLSYPAMRHCVSDVYVSIANAMGVDIKTFGNAQHCKGPLPGLTS